MVAGWEVEEVSQAGPAVLLESAIRLVFHQAAAMKGGAAAAVRRFDPAYAKR